jgi:hypothetical protein
MKLTNNLVRNVTEFSVFWRLVIGDW